MIHLSKVVTATLKYAISITIPAAYTALSHWSGVRAAPDSRSVSFRCFEVTRPITSLVTPSLFSSKIWMERVGIRGSCRFPNEL